MIIFYEGNIFLKKPVYEIGSFIPGKPKLIFEIDGLFAGLFQVIGKRLEFKLTF